MEATTQNRLHPLLTAAAVSVTVFSAVGIGALTGVIPTSMGSSQATPPALVSAAPQAVAPVPEPVAPVQAAPEAPAKKPVQKAVVRKPAPRPAEPVVYRDYPEPLPPAPVAQASLPPAPIAQTPRPVARAMNVGTVEAVREITDPGEGTGLGAVAGGIAGAVVGKQFGNGSGKTIMTVLGAAGGAYGGHEIEKRVRGNKRWEVTVRMDDGTIRTVPLNTEHNWQAGDRVRLVEGRLQAV